LVHALPSTFDSAPEVSATDNNGYVDTELTSRLFDFLGNLLQHTTVETEPH
jgi:hypothetical protein